MDISDIKALFNSLYLLTKQRLNKLSCAMYDFGWLNGFTTKYKNCIDVDSYGYYIENWVEKKNVVRP